LIGKNLEQFVFSWEKCHTYFFGGYLDQMAKKKDKKSVEGYHWGSEPTWDGLTEEQAKSKYCFALNWYNYMATDSQKKKWVLDYAKKKKMKEEVLKKLQGIDPKKFDIGYGDAGADDMGLDTGIYARLLLLGAPVPKKKELKLKKYIVYLVEKKNSVSEDGNPQNTPNIQENIKNKASSIFAEILNIEDKIISSRFKDPGDEAFSIIKREETKGVHCKYVKDRLMDTIREIELSFKDSDFKEAYSIFKKPELKKYLTWMKSLVVECDLKIANVSRIRKPRKKKVRSAEDVAKRAQIQESFSELNLKSMPASSIVGSNNVVLYNTKTKELQILNCFPGQELSIKGTTITNFNSASSIKKKVRKVEIIKTFFSKKMSITKIRELMEKTLRTKSSVPNGRLNKYTMVLSVF